MRHALQAAALIWIAVGSGQTLPAADLPAERDLPAALIDRIECVAWRRGILEPAARRERARIGPTMWSPRLDRLFRSLAALEQYEAREIRPGIAQPAQDRLVAQLWPNGLDPRFIRQRTANATVIAERREDRARRARCTSLLRQAGAMPELR